MVLEIFLGLVFLIAGLLFLISLLFPNKSIWEVVTGNRALPKVNDGWWGRGSADKVAGEDDPTIRKFEVKVEESVLDDLRQRLNRTLFAEPIENVQFQYGFNGDELRKIIDYWKTDYDWRKQEKMLNTFDHFITQIEGIDIHFIWAKAAKDNIENTKVREFPVLLLHGWPGSIVEFYKILPLLTKCKEPVDVVCPSIPGYGFSEDPHQSGFDALDAARIFNKLMVRLGYQVYYVQGGDWGSAIAKLMAIFYPDRVRGILVNMISFLRPRGILPMLKLLLDFLFPYKSSHTPPSLVYKKEKSPKLGLFKSISFLIRESGYFHIQATKPDTIGASLVDSPAGLAAYILEKFAIGTNGKNIYKSDGGLTEKFSMDELLTNVMVYWLSGRVTSSLRFYKENADPPRDKKEDSVIGSLASLPVHVPAGLAYFPHEVLNVDPKYAKYVYRNIIRVSYFSRGGHFAALEEPELLAEEIFAFIDEVEERVYRRSNKTVSS